MTKLPNIKPFRQRYNELEKLANSEIFKDPNKAKDISREHNKIKNVIDTFFEVESCIQSIEESKDLLDDPEFASEAS